MCMAMSAQGLKTYSGPYNDSRYMALDVPKATYTYKNAEDGTRIFEGNFMSRIIMVLSRKLIV